MIKRRVIIDQDHLNILYKNANNNNENYSYLFTSMKNFSDEIFTVVSGKNISHYVLGVAGVGKSTYAMNELGGIYINTLDELMNIFSGGKEDVEYIVINAQRPKKEIADQADSITILQADETIILDQRNQRENLNSFTNFGRSKGATKGASTCDAILVALCGTYYLNKTKIGFMNNNKIWNISDLQNDHFIPIEKSSIIQFAGKMSPPHLGHTTMLYIKDNKEAILQTLAVKVNDKNSIENYIPHYTQVIIAGNEGAHGLRNYEKIELIKKIPSFEGVIFDLMVMFDERYYLHTGQGKVIEVDIDHSIGILGKDRLPQGFHYGSKDHPMIQGFLDENPRTPGSLTAPLRGMISQGISLFMRAQDIQSEDGLDLSSSAYREEILKANPDINKISNMFDSHIAPYMTYQENINILKLRLNNQKIIEKVNNNITNDLLDLAIEVYTNLYGDEDLYTKDSKKKYKNFDLRIVSKNDLKREEKKLFIKQHQESLKTTLDTIKSSYRSLLSTKGLILDNTVLISE